MDHLRLIIHVAVLCLGFVAGLDPPLTQGQFAENGLLQIRSISVPPTIDGRLDDSSWQDAARIGPLEPREGPVTSATVEALFSADADHLYVGLRCSGANDARPAGKRGTGEFVELLFNTNGDRNSYYLIRILPTDAGKVISSYNEHAPPWHDRTWQPKFPFALAKSAEGWCAELALPLSIFSKTKTIAGQIGFNLRRCNTSSRETHCWRGVFTNPPDWGTLPGVAPREKLPPPDYTPIDRLYRVPTAAQRSLLAKQPGETIRLGPGSAHPGTTGEVKLELEGFLMAGDPHVSGIIWDLAVDQRTGELYALSDPRPVREAPELRVFDRHKKYLRTIMPLNPTLPRRSVEDLCAHTAREGETDLVVPKLFETLCGSLSIYGAWWHLPQKIVLAPNGDLILANIYRGTMWRMRPDGGLPADGWTSAWHAGRNEPFEAHDWTQNYWTVPDLKNYLPFPSLRYPYFCFDPAGSLYLSAGQSSRPTRQYAYHWEVGQRGGSYHQELPAGEDRSNYVWKCRVASGVRFQELAAFGGFAEPSGLAHDGRHLIVADAGNNRLQVFGKEGRAIASLSHYRREGKPVPIFGPTALSIDGAGSLYVLVAARARPADEHIERTLAAIQKEVLHAARQGPQEPTRLLKLKSWHEPDLLAISPPLDADVLQIAVDAGVSPPLVWVANGSGPGTLVQLSGDDLTKKAQWDDRGTTLSCPRQSGNQPILNIDPQTGHLYVEDDSNYRIKQYGTVYRLDQDGKILASWPPLYFNALGLNATSPWWTLDYSRHFRYPDEPLFLDSIFGADGRVYRWKLGKAGVEILRCDRAGRPIPFPATGTNALSVDVAMKVNFWHDVYPGMDIDRHGNIYYPAKAEIAGKAGSPSAYDAIYRRLDVYDADGRLRTKGLLHLECVRGIQVDEEGNLYVLHRPTQRPYDDYLALSRFSPRGGSPQWSRPWEGFLGQAQVLFAPCHCITARQHQTLDEKGYLYAAAKYSIQVIDRATGRLVGQFGSYGNMDCQGKGSRFPHPELPFGTIAALAVWKDRLFAVDVLNRRIVKCRIVYSPRL